MLVSPLPIVGLESCSESSMIYMLILCFSAVLGAELFANASLKALPLEGYHGAMSAEDVQVLYQDYQNAL
jgi:hypothetical protein